MTKGRAVLVANPKTSGGADRRTESLAAILADLDYSVDVIQPAINRRRPPTPMELRLLARGDIVPEALAWNASEIGAQIAEFDPDLLLLQTARAVHPQLTRLSPGRHLILDLVDRLSSSYRQRATQAGGATAAALRLLASSHQRFENRLALHSRPVIAAGYREATALGVTWIPNVVDPPVERASTTSQWSERPYDAVFFGTLSYQPNIEAVQQFEQWTRSLRWNGSVLIAGRQPTIEVTKICERNGWTLLPDFPSTEWLADQARIAVAPLRSTAGIQNKVLEAGQVGQAQVVSTAALAGLDPHIPLRGADDATTFLGELDRLLEHPGNAKQQVQAVQQYLRTNLVAEAVAPRLQAVLAEPAGRHQPHTRVNDGSR